MGNVFNLPNLGFGLGLRSVHYQDVLTQETSVDWFEIISENYMDTQGRPWRILKEVAEKYPIVFHGVTLSICGQDELSKDYLRELKTLAQEIKPVWISDHICWTGVHGNQLHDLLPVPYTEESLKHTVNRIKQVQDFLERPLILENPSTYIEFNSSTLSEAEFLAELSKEANCGLLLDVNNVYVSAYNHQLDPYQYIDALPEGRVVQIHLAGHENRGRYIVDTHNDVVVDEVWGLYDYTLQKFGEVSTMVEWDDDIPDFETVQNEILKAKQASLRAPSTISINDRNEDVNKTKVGICKSYEGLQKVMLDGDVSGGRSIEWLKLKDNRLPIDQLSVYVNGYRLRLYDCVSEDYPVLEKYLGEQHFSDTLKAYIEHTPPRHYNLNHYCRQFSDWVGKDTELQHSHPAALDLARYESLSSQIFDYKQEETLKISDMQASNESEFFQLKIHLLESAHFLDVDHEIASYIEACDQNKAISSIEKKQQTLLVYSLNEFPQYLELDEDEVYFLKQLERSDSILHAFELFLENQDHEAETLPVKVQAWFKKWGEAQCLRKI